MPQRQEGEPLGHGPLALGVDVPAHAAVAVGSQPHARDGVGHLRLGRPDQGEGVARGAQPLLEGRQLDGQEGQVLPPGLAPGGDDGAHDVGVGLGVRPVGLPLVPQQAAGGVPGDLADHGLEQAPGAAGVRGAQRQGREVPEGGGDEALGQARVARVHHPDEPGVRKGPGQVDHPRAARGGQVGVRRGARGGLLVLGEPHLRARTPQALRGAPGGAGGPAPGAADDADRHPQAPRQPRGQEVGDGGEPGEVLVGGGAPVAEGGVVVLLQLARVAGLGHVQEAHVRVGRQGAQGLVLRVKAQEVLHIGLPARDPDLPHGHVLAQDAHLPVRHPQPQPACRLLGLQHGLPASCRVAPPDGAGQHLLRGALAGQQAHLDVGPGRGTPPDPDRPALLEDQVVGEGGGKGQGAGHTGSCDRARRVGPPG